MGGGRGALHASLSGLLFNINHPFVKRLLKQLNDKWHILEEKNRQLAYKLLFIGLV